MTTCLKLLRANVPTCPYFPRVYVPSFFTCLRAYNHSLLYWGSLLTSVFLWIICRSSHWRCSLRKGVLRSFLKVTGKHLCKSLLFNKVAGLRPATLLKNKIWHRCFPINFAKFLRAHFLRSTSGQLLLYWTFHSTQYPKETPASKTA